MGSCIDLRKFQDPKIIEDAFSKIVSGGKYGYKTVIERKVEPVKCSSCSKVLDGNEKFCPECGTKTSFPEKKQ